MFGSGSTTTVSMALIDDPYRTLYPARSVSSVPSVFCVTGVQISVAVPLPLVTPSPLPLLLTVALPLETPALPHATTFSARTVPNMPRHMRRRVPEFPSACIASGLVANWYITSAEIDDATRATGLARARNGPREERRRLCPQHPPRIWFERFDRARGAYVELDPKAS